MKTRKIKFVYAGAILISFLSCNVKNNKFIMLESKGLNENNLRLNKLSFYNKDIGFVVGSSDEVTSNPNTNSDTFAFLNRTALLYKTTDGGNTWIKKDFGEGSFVNIVHMESKIFAIKVSDESPNSYIYLSDDLGENWSSITFFPNIVTDIFSIDNKLLLIAKDEASVFRIYILNTFGKSWDELKSPLPIYDAIAKGRNLFYIYSEIPTSNQKNLIIEFNIEDSSNKIIKLPKGFNCFFLNLYNGVIKLLGIKDGYITVYSLQNNGQIKYEYSYLENNNYFPQGYYSNNGEDWIIAGKRNEFDVSNIVLKTTDNGKSWERLNFLKEKYISPFCFINVNKRTKAWFYSGSGKFQLLN